MKHVRRFSTQEETSTCAILPILFPDTCIIICDKVNNRICTTVITVNTCVTEIKSRFVAIVSQSFYFFCAIFPKLFIVSSKKGQIDMIIYLIAPFSKINACLFIYLSAQERDWRSPALTS